MLRLRDWKELFILLSRQCHSRIDAALDRASALFRVPPGETRKSRQLLDWQRDPFMDESPVLLLTGSAGGGKSFLAALKMHNYLQRNAGATGLVVRKVRVSLVNSTVAMMEHLFGQDGIVHFPSKSKFVYPNNSVLLYAGIEDRKQRQRLRSVGQRGGVDVAWMEEATEFEEDDFNALSARMRGQCGTYRQIILSTNPDAPTHWIHRRLILGNEAKIFYSHAADNPHNPLDYADTLSRLTGVEGMRLREGLWTQASGLVYDVWSDGNVTDDAEYSPGEGSVIWAVDDGYSGELDALGEFTATSHPRVFLLAQQRADGRICVFHESYRVKTLSDDHLEEITILGYPDPEFAAVDSSAAELRGRMNQLGIYTRRASHDVEEGIKELRNAIAPDANGWRRVLVHPRCRHLRAEMASYRRDDATGKPVKQFDHGADALRYLIWSVRHG